MEDNAPTRCSPLAFLDHRIKKAVELLEEFTRIRREAGFDVRIPDSPSSVRGRSTGFRGRQSTC